MTTPIMELEGTWEEIAAHAKEFQGRKVRLTVFPPETEPLPPEPMPLVRPASGRSLLRHAGTWQGDDLEECLQDVYANRTKARF